MKEKTSKRKRGRGRFKSAADALQQLEEIEKAQQRMREEGTADRIRSVRKSKDRFRNAVRNLSKPEDVLDEFE